MEGSHASYASCLGDPEEVARRLSQQDDAVEDMPDVELFAALEDVRRKNEILDIETNMFERFLKRVDPKEIGSTGVSEIADKQPQRFRSRSRSRGQSITRTSRLTAEQKCDIATRELEELREEIERMKEEAEKKLDNYRAIMEETDIRYTEVKKAQYEFNRDIMNGAVNPRTNKIIAERVTRSIEDKIRSRDTLIEKLRLKNSTLKVQKKKLQLQLKQKEEMGEVLHEVDFNQLKIENSQYLERIDERNKELLNLKLTTTNVLQVLNMHKKKLHTLTQESDRLHSEIGSRDDLHLKIDQEMAAVHRDKVQAERQNRQARRRLSDYAVPHVMDYVRENAALTDLQAKVTSWERKVEIATMALRTHRVQWSRIKLQAKASQMDNHHKLATNTPAPSWHSRTRSATNRQVISFVN